jgi:hypothetical protein
VLGLVYDCLPDVAMTEAKKCDLKNSSAADWDSPRP